MARFLVCILFLLPLLSRADETVMTLAIPVEVSSLSSVIEYTRFLKDSLKDAGINLVAREVPQRRSRELVEKGQVDSIVFDDLISGFKDRKQLTSVSFPIATVPGSIFYVSGKKKFDPEKLKDLRGGYTLGNLRIEEELKKHSLNATGLSSAAQGFRMMLAKRLDYFVTLKTTGDSILENDPQAKQLIKAYDKPLVSIPVYFTMNKRLQDKIPKVEAAFKKHLHGDLSKYPLIQECLNRSVK